jgi:hypothetical protein
MRTLFTTILFGFSFLTFSQGPYQIADSTKKWNTVYYGFWSWGIAHCSGTIISKTAEEVLFNNTTFCKVYETQDSLQQDWVHVGYLREDTITNKVYFSKWGSDEIGLIYDFNLATGDSVVIDNYYGGFEDVLLICDSIDSLTINGSFKKRLFLSSPGFADNDIWIEGIGSKFGLLLSGLNGSSMVGGGTDLLCCSKSDTLIYFNSTYNSCFIHEFYPRIASEYYDTAYLDTPYEFQIQVSDTNNIGSFALVGDVIPEDFEFNETTGLLTGIPSTTGSFTCIITIKNYDIGFLTDILYSDITVVLPTNIKSIPKNPEIKIHPNPFSRNFSITYNGNLTDPYYLEIFNFEGKMIDKKTIAETIYNVDCSHYKNGIYLFKINDSNQRIIRIEKVLKK